MDLCCGGDMQQIFLLDHGKYEAATGVSVLFFYTKTKVSAKDIKKKIPGFSSKLFQNSNTLCYFFWKFNCCIEAK